MAYDKTTWINNETVVDADNLNKLEKQVHLLSVSSDTNSERLENLENLTDTKIDDVEAVETDDGTIVKFIANEQIKQEILVQGGDSVKITPDEPSRNSLWVDTGDEDVEYALNNSGVLEEFRTELGEMSSVVQALKYILEKKLDAGYFKDKEPATDEPHNNPLKTYTDNPYAGNVGAIAIKRGNKEDLLEEPCMEGEFLFCLDTEELYIGNKGMKRLIARVGNSSGGGSGDGGNVTGEYVMLETPDRQYYRLFLNNAGQLKIVHGDAFFENDPDITESSRFKGLLINHVFAGGAAKRNVSPVTHSFIELYNNTNYRINLKGLSLQVAENAEDWKVLELSGIVNPRSSFLVRCKEITNKDTARPRLIVENYDQDWNIELSDMGIKVYLTVGITPCKYPNPWNINGNEAKAEGYIDLVGLGGDSAGQSIDGFEKAYLNVANNYTSIHRIDFKDTDVNNLDFIALDWRTADKEVYRPRCVADGKWDMYYDKIKLESHRPQLVNVGFGEDGHTTRTFTWQSTRTKFGCVKYRLVGERKFNIVESNKQIIVHGDIDATGHSVIIRDLKPGTYEYQVGEEGRWSDLYTFTVTAEEAIDRVKFLHISDQQATTEIGYEAWRKASNYIYNNEDYDFIINTGDISDSANRSFEWRYYYEYGKNILGDHEHMTCCGNNDLVDKKYPDAFRWYSTYENELAIKNEAGEVVKEFPSVYSWNYGFIHFISLNSNVSVNNLNYGEEQPTPIEPQIKWLKEDMAKPENQKTWTVVYMHESPYTIINNAKLHAFHEAFCELGVDLVLCGHHHMYSRSHGLGPRVDGQHAVLSRAAAFESGDGIPIPEDQRIMRNGGVVYVMTQASGSKLQGKTSVASNASDWSGTLFRHFEPSYVMFDITPTEIKMNMYEIKNIMPIETVFENPPTKVEKDNFKIIKES